LRQSLQPTVRRAVPADMPRLVAWGHEFHAHADQPWELDEDGFVDVMRVLMETQFVAVSDDGFICGLKVANPIAKDWIVAKEFLWWANGSGAALFAAFREWAKDANEIQFSCPTARKAFERHAKITEMIYSELPTCV
jgi:hypothetical protein